MLSDNAKASFKWLLGTMGKSDRTAFEKVAQMCRYSARGTLSRWMIAGAAACVCTLAAAQSGESREDPCTTIYREQVGECLLEAQRTYAKDSTDFSYFETCQRKYEPERHACRGRVECREARINIDWVMAQDRGAQETYRRALAEGRSPILAVIQAQRHNPPARQSVERCAAWGAEYMAREYPSGPRPLGPPPVAARPPQKDGGGRGDEEPRYRANCHTRSGNAPQTFTGTIISLRVRNECNGPVTIAACFKWKNGAWLVERQTVSGKKSPVTTPTSVNSLGPGNPNFGIPPRNELPILPVQHVIEEGPSASISCP